MRDCTHREIVSGGAWCHHPLRFMRDCDESRCPLHDEIEEMSFERQKGECQSKDLPCAVKLHYTCSKSYCPKLAKENLLVENSAGYKRSSKKGLGKPSLIPTEMLTRLAKWYEAREVKHGTRNWEKGYSISETLDSAFRHWCLLRDKDESEDHAAALIWNIAAVMFYEKYKPEFDDRVKPGEVK